MHMCWYFGRFGGFTCRFFIFCFHYFTSANGNKWNAKGYQYSKSIRYKSIWIFINSVCWMLQFNYGIIETVSCCIFWGIYLHSWVRVWLCFFSASIFISHKFSSLTRLKRLRFFDSTLNLCKFHFVCTCMQEARVSMKIMKYTLRIEK